MKNSYRKSVLLIILLIIISGCMATPEVTMLRESHPPKQITAPIDIFYTKSPDRPYEEIAKIKVGDTDDKWNLKQIKLKAREIGADAVIIIGRYGTYGYGTHIGATSIISVGEGYGMAAIAIVYKK